MARIGVFICHCGENIGGHGRLPRRWPRRAARMPGVVHSVDYKYMCSDPGQSMIQDAIREQKLDRRRRRRLLAAHARADLPPRLRRGGPEPLPVRDGQPPRALLLGAREGRRHHRRRPSTSSASLVAKVKRNQPLQPIKVPVTKTALVIGGGIAGIQAALDIANAGHKVILVEREPSIGGHMAQLSETFPTLDCSQCILTPRMVEVAQHPNITLYTYSRARERSTASSATSRRRSARRRRSVDEKLCTGCGVVLRRSARTKKIPSEFNAGPGHADGDLRARSRRRCRTSRSSTASTAPTSRRASARLCEKVCPHQGHPLRPGGRDRRGRRRRRRAGHRLQTIKHGDFFPEYGYGKYPDVIDGLQFERLASASGPTGGAIKRPSDGKEPETVVFIACAGSPRPGQGHPVLLQDLLHVHRQARDALQAQGARRQGLRLLHGHPRRRQEVRRVRAPGDRGGRRQLRPRPRLARSTRRTASSIVKGADTLLGRRAGGDRGRPGRAGHRRAVASAGAEELAQKLHVSYDAVPLLHRGASRSCGRWRRTPPASSWPAPARRPRTSPRRWPRPRGAAAKVCGLFSQAGADARAGRRRGQPPARRRSSRPASAASCASRPAPTRRSSTEEIKARDGKLIKTVAKVNPGLCQGCGTCVATLPVEVDRPAGLHQRAGLRRRCMALLSRR